MFVFQVLSPGEAGRGQGGESDSDELLVRHEVWPQLRLSQVLGSCCK